MGPSRLGLGEGQPVLVVVVNADHVGAGSRARALSGGRGPVGDCECRLVRPERAIAGLPRGARRWRVLGGRDREVPLYLVRDIPVRSAMAPRACGPRIRRAVRDLRQTELLAQGTPR